MWRRSPLFIILLFLLLGSNGYWSWVAWSSAKTNQTVKTDNSYQNTILFTRIVELIRQDYVDPEKTDYKSLTYAALRGMLSSLDPHSQFMDEEAFAEMQKDTRGEFSGLGIVVGMKDNFLVVIAPIEDTPSFRAGIMPGDRILKIDGRNTDKLALNAAIKLLRGKKGEKVKLTIMRPQVAKDKKESTGDILEFELTRDLIKVSTVKEAKLLPAEIAGEDKIGYIRLEQFNENTTDEFDRALTQLEKEGMQLLVLDLRNNPGGLLDPAVEVAGRFLPPSTVIVSTQGRTPQQSYEYRARDTRKRPSYPMAVLVNSYSASGAEIVAGALKDMRRAILVGEKTFGKGSVQSVQDLGNGIGLRLTTAKYYTPSKKVIHEVGVEPDIFAPVTEEEERLLLRMRSLRFLSETEKQQLRDFKDTQLERAVSSLKGIRIYTQRQNASAPASTNAPTTKP